MDETHTKIREEELREREGEMEGEKNGEGKGKLEVEKHVEFILGLEHKTRTSDALYFTDHKRLSGVYWAAASLALMGRLEALPWERVMEFVMSCYDATRGGFAGNTDQDAHLLYTTSAVQIAALYNRLDLVDVDFVARAVARLQNEDGSFCGDEWGEVDSRFSYCALLTLTLLRRVHLVDVRAAKGFVKRCQNFDGAFGCIPDAESHAGNTFCCVGALSLIARHERSSSGGLLDECERQRLGLWLCERQLPCGGLNGRPDKQEDVCYSWWVTASLKMVDLVHLIDPDRLRGFILSCQHPSGGLADRPGNVPDVFHTLFGVAALSLLQQPTVGRVHEAFCLPEETTRET